MPIHHVGIRERGTVEPTSAESGNVNNQRRRLWLHPAGVSQFLSRGRHPDFARDRLVREVCDHGLEQHRADRGIGIVIGVATWNGIKDELLAAQRIQRANRFIGIRERIQLALVVPRIAAEVISRNAGTDGIRPGIMRIRGPNPKTNVQWHVHQLANRIPASARTKKRNHQIKPRSGTPLAQSFAEIPVGSPDLPMRRRIEKAAQPDGGVGAETFCLHPRAMPLALAAIVEEPRRISQVMSAVADHGAEGLRHGNVIDKTHGIEEDTEQAVIHLPGTAIETFNRIGHRIEIGHLTRLQFVRGRIRCRGLGIKVPGRQGHKSSQ